jgi:diguanylate cyclase (GGDEF)-like protein/PAS domain S-box-containing protein
MESPTMPAAPEVRLPARHLWAPAVAIGVGITVVHALSGPGAVQDWTYLVVGAGASLAAWIGALRGDRHLAAVLIALGVSLTALGDTVNQVLVWARPVAPDLSVADLTWVASYLVLIAALLLVLRRSSSTRLDLDGGLDICSVTVLAFLLQWEVSVRGLATDGSLAPIVRAVWILYPALDGVLLVLVARALLAGQMRSRSALLLAIGTSGWLVADVAVTVAVPDGHSTPRIDVGWLLGSIALAAAAWQPRPVAIAPRHRDGAATAPVGYHRVAVGLLPLAVPGGIELIEYLRGDNPNPLPLYAASLALLAIAFLRAVRLMRSDHDARARLRSQERLAVAVADTSSDAVVLLDRDGRIVTSAPRLASLIGQEGTDLQGSDLLTSVDPIDLEAARSLFAQTLEAPGQMFEWELRIRHAGGRPLWLGARLVNLLDDPDVHAVVLTLHDVTERRQAQDELAHQAVHDGLTGLANRTLFTDRVEQALRRSARSGLQPAVIFLDLDGFKGVNDTLGHQAGDELLRVVGQRLTAAVRTGDTVARFGGDEFAILVEPSAWPLHDAEATAARILRLVTEPVILGDQTVALSASLGVAVADPTASAGSMLRDADVAMYRAKATGRGRWVAYDSSMRTAVIERLQLATDLTKALDLGQLALAYQPVVELEGEQLVGFEALIRWNHPTVGQVAPDQFISLAEEKGLIVPIGAWVLEEACRTAAHWHRTYPEQASLSMSVNVSAHQIASGDLVAHLTHALAASGLDPATLIVELTESALVVDPEAAAEQLRHIRGLGVRIAIDDFGTGYSSLAYLRMFPLDILKIDRSFVETITDREHVPALVRGLLELAHTLELETLAEGVEHEAQRDGLRDASCDLAQGFLFGKPLDVADAEALLLRVGAIAGHGRA